MEKKTSNKQPLSETGNGVLLFAVNGVRFEVASVDPSTTLPDFLRYRTPFTSVKLSCGEGGCGACVVMLSKYNPVLDLIEDFTVSSCLTLVCSINGCSVTTSEGIGNSKDGFHPIHQRFSGFHASQCGFCTPGMCISLYSALTNANKMQRLEPQAGFSKLTVSEAEKAVAGHLCRCTGYRPIADACKSFAANVDLEDLGLNSFWRKGDPQELKLKGLPSYRPNLIVNEHPNYLKERSKLAVKLDSNNYSWYSPTSLEELRSLLNSDGIENGRPVKLLVGNSGTGYYKELEDHGRKYIDLRHMPELSILKKNDEGIEIGAAVSISRIIAFLKDVGISNSSSHGGLMVFQKIAGHMKKIGSKFIRNSASIGGNLVMAQRKSFPSDLATVLLSVSSTVSLATCEKHEILTLEDFLARTPIDSRSVLLSITIPLLEPKSKGKIAGQSKSSLYFETYRAAPRPLGGALPYLNAAFLADVSSHANGVFVNDIKLAFGAYGAKHAIRAQKVEEYLSGKLLTIDVLREALRLVKQEVVPESGTSHATYRTSLAVGFLFQFLSPFSGPSASAVAGSPNENITCLLECGSENLSDGSDFQVGLSRLLSSAKQEVKLSRDYYPVGEPIKKTASAIQASGEALYVGDIPSPPNCLYGAFVYSTKPLARVKGTELRSEAKPGGVAAVITYKDIPDQGKNDVGFVFGVEPLFADEVTRATGQAIALVVAETQTAADIAARTAVVSYDMENLDPPILSVEEAVKRSSFIEVPPFVYPKCVGDFSKGMAEADHKILSAEIKLGSQYFFYMETQTALAVPDEDNCLEVYSSIQSPELAHGAIAKCVGVPEHNVRVITRRVGGGFGGKSVRAIPVAAACALAAHILRRPVRIYNNRKTDMIMSGGRHPMKITYNVGFKSNGKVTALHLDLLIDAGIFPDASPLIPLNFTKAIKKYNWGAFSFDIKVCKTNSCSKTAMRAPGEVQGFYIAEAIIERIASELSIEVDSVRSLNLHTHESLDVFYEGASGDAPEYTLPDIWGKLSQSSSLLERVEAIAQFNQSRKWHKRGISRVPLVHEVEVRPAPGKVSILSDGSVVVEVGGIELGQGLWTKVKQMAAFVLSSIGCDGMEDFVERIRVVQTDTLSLVQGGVTAGSTTSESSCQAVRLCCNTLVERLTSLKNELQEQMGAVNWSALIPMAHMKAVNMAAHSYYVPEADSIHYLNYGAAVSEVEINLLTGETTILRTDIIYDCGQSLNPAVDLGQIEGAFVQGIGFFMLEEYLVNNDGMMITDSTWTYKIPTIDTIPKQFNVEVLNSGHHKNRVLSSKASGEPPLLLAASVHCATRAAIRAARKQIKAWGKLEFDAAESAFQLDIPAIMPVVKNLCGLDSVEIYLGSLSTDLERVE